MKGAQLELAGQKNLNLQRGLKLSGGHKKTEAIGLSAQLNLRKSLRRFSFSFMNDLLDGLGCQRPA